MIDEALREIHASAEAEGVLLPQEAVQVPAVGRRDARGRGRADAARAPAADDHGVGREIRAVEGHHTDVLTELVHGGLQPEGRAGPPSRSLSSSFAVPFLLRRVGGRRKSAVLLSPRATSEGAEGRVP